MYRSIAIIHSISIALLLLLAGGCTPQTEAAMPVSETSVPFVPLNQRLSNADSDLPEFVKFDQQVERFMQEWRLTGVSIALMRNDSLVYCKGYGFANPAKDVKADVKHLYRVASISKLITAAAVMKLCEEQKLSLDSPVFGKNGILTDSAYLGYKDLRLSTITVEHLLRHQGGFSRRRGDPLFETTLIAQKLGYGTPYTNEDLIKYAMDYRLSFQPGGSASYSNLGYSLLEKVISVAANKAYETYVREELLRPAGITDILIGEGHDTKAHPNEVRYTEPEDSEPIQDFSNPALYAPKSNGGNDIRLLGAAGGWIASAVELARFVASINGNDNGMQILSAESVDRMISDTEKQSPLGWMSITSNGVWTRSGSMAGTSTLIHRNPDGTTWVFLTNTSTWKASSFKYEIARMMGKALQRVEAWPERDLFHPCTFTPINN